MAGVATDGADNVFLAGRDADGAQLRKFSPTGALLWSRLLMGDDVYGAGWTGLAGVSDGGVVAAGDRLTYDALSNTYARHQIIAKYSSSGTLLWTVETPRVAALAASGRDVLLAGSIPGAIDGDLWIRKVHPAGALLWERTYDSGGMTPPSIWQKTAAASLSLGVSAARPLAGLAQQP